MTTFSELNRERCEAPSGFDHPIAGWSLSDWYTAFMGEAGEAGNVIKKINRLRDGIKNTKGEDYESLRADLGDELADAYIYLDLLFQAAEIDKTKAVKEKFNKDSVKRKLSSNFMIHMLYSNIVTTRHSFNMRSTVEDPAPVDDWKERLRIEHTDLLVRTHKLSVFINGPTFAVLPNEDKGLLYDQQKYMCAYLEVLNERRRRAGLPAAPAMAAEPRPAREPGAVMDDLDHAAKLAQEKAEKDAAPFHPAPREFSDEQIAKRPILRFFHYRHLPPVLAARSKPFCNMALFIIQTTPYNTECNVALRKLLEAKDAAVRAAL